MLKFTPERAEGFCLAVLNRCGLPSDQAQTCADAMMFATLRGLDTHGLVLLPGLVGHLRRGAIVTDAEIDTISETETTAVLKGNGAPGAVIAARAMDLAIEKARERGLGAVTAFNCHHFGAASFYPSRALPHRMIGLTACNAGAVVAPYGGAKAVHGTNPLAYAAPAGAEGPMVLDIATSMVAHGQIAKVGRRGEQIPLGWALDASGRPTTDPTAGYSGVLLPFGGHKGYGIGLLVDVLTGALAGSTIGRGVDQRNTNPETGGQSLFMLAIDVGHFVPFATYTDRMDQLIREIHATPPAEGFTEVFAPGDIERRQEEVRRRDGIPIYPGDWDAIVKGLEAAGLPVAELVQRFGPVEG
jgi:LDH2 family malate/lactate/ureidoglycolate dehydrogenase